MGRIGEDVTLAVGSVGSASIAVQIRGTLAIGQTDVFETGDAGQPVAFGFDEHDAIFYLDPTTFRFARASGNYIEMDLGYVQLEVNDPPADDEAFA